MPGELQKLSPPGADFGIQFQSGLTFEFRALILTSKKVSLPKRTY